MIIDSMGTVVYPPVWCPKCGKVSLEWHWVKDAADPNKWNKVLWDRHQNEQHICNQED